jgi:hypothetical protein
MQAQNRKLISYTMLLAPVLVAASPAPGASAPGGRFVVHTNQEGKLVNLVTHSNQEGRTDAAALGGTMAAYSQPLADAFAVGVGDDLPAGPDGWVPHSRALMFTEAAGFDTDLGAVFDIGILGIDGAALRSRAPSAATRGDAPPGVVPGPGTLSLLGLAAMVARRRRRRASV